jgi:hypothetical protein
VKSVRVPAEGEEPGRLGSSGRFGPEPRPLA